VSRVALQQCFIALWVVVHRLANQDEFAFGVFTDVLRALSQHKTSPFQFLTEEIPAAGELH
jgi:hypothetical protein